MRNIALKLRYDGSRYHGWQVQKNEISVCQTVEQAVEATCGKAHVIGCGRTDAGVHANRYCANFRTESTIPIERIPLAINSRLPMDIAVLDAVEAAEDFNAIGSCIKKEYVYRIHNTNIRDPFLENRVCFYPQRLDLDRMKKAAEAFVGTHDFKAVRSVGTETKTTVRTVHWCDVSKQEDLITVAITGRSHHGGHLRRRFSVQHVPGHRRDAGIRILRQTGAGGDPGTAGAWGPETDGSYDAAAGAVYEPSVV